MMVLAAIGQICSTASLASNLAQCQTLVRRAAAAGAKALFLPEASDYISLNSREAMSLVQPTTTSPFVQGLCSSAREFSLPISVGIHEPTSPLSDRLCNSLIWINAKGDIVHRYHKLHVFDIDMSSTGGPRMKESNTTEPGNDIGEPYEMILPDKSNFGKVGSLICFDVRFPEPALALRRKGAKVLLYPSAFTVPTGKLHWEVLLRARAIENQCWVIASAQVGRHNEKRVSYGDSIVIDPQGRVKGRLDRVEHAHEEEQGTREPQVLLIDIDLNSVDEVRQSIHLLRRTDVYAEL